MGSDKHKKARHRRVAHDKPRAVEHEPLPGQPAAVGRAIAAGHRFAHQADDPMEDRSGFFWQWLERAGMRKRGR